MLDFYIITDCTERGLYRKARLAKRISQKYPEARLVKFQSPEDVPAAQAFCSASGIGVTSHEWEELLTAGRLSEYAEKGVLPPPSEAVAKEIQQEKPKKDTLPRDAAAVIYTDGSYVEPDCDKKKRRKHAIGGWSAVIILRNFYDAHITLSGYTECLCKDHDSYYMEMMAVAKALKRLNKYDVSGNIMLYTDCQSLVSDYNKRLAGWQECGWKKEDGTRIRNWRLWRKIWRRARDIRLHVNWVKGHAKNVYNNQCHYTAQAEAMMRKTCRKQATDTENDAVKEA